MTQLDLFASPAFEPTLQAAHARLVAVNPEAYARTRNHLDGAVTRLSPYLTHGFLTLPEVLHGVLQRQALEVQHRFVFELGWREYFHHVWQHAGDAIFASLHERPLPDAAYASELPADICRGATGVPAIDLAVRELCASGWLHNHARLWLASYVVHLRKVHWRASIDEPALVNTLPPAFTAPDAGRVAGRAVQLVHPGSLGSVAPEGTLRVGVLGAEFHRARPWSGARWRFVATRMSGMCDLLWAGDAGALRQALAAAASVDGRADPHLQRHLGGLELQEPVRLFAWPRRRCASFTQFWRQVTSGLGSAGELLQRAN